MDPWIQPWNEKFFTLPTSHEPPATGSSRSFTVRRWPAAGPRLSTRPVDAYGPRRDAVGGRTRDGARTGESRTRPVTTCRDGPAEA